MFESECKGFEIIWKSRCGGGLTDLSGILNLIKTH